MKDRMNLNELFSHSDNEDAIRISDSRPVFSEAKKDELYKRIQEKVAESRGENEFADRVSGVEVRHGHGILRYVGIAAALAVLIGGLGGGHYLIKNNMSGTPTYTESEIEIPEETVDATDEVKDTFEGPEEEEVVIADFDMSTQIGIFGKMINAIDYYDRASGVMVFSDTARKDLCTESAFNVDHTTGKAFDVITRYNLFNDYHDVADDQPMECAMDQYLGVFDVYCDGENCFQMDHDSNVASITITAKGQASHRTREQTDPQEIIDCMTSIDASESEQTYTPIFGKLDESGIDIRVGITNTRFARMLLEPLRTAIQYLYDFSTWQITENSYEYAGRECIVISGNCPGIVTGAASYMNETNFTLVVDKATGCLLKMKTYNDAGELCQWLITKEINFDADAEPVPEKDVTIIDTESAKSEIKTNSNGETYGSCNKAIVIDNYDDIPDLIENNFFYNGGGYVRKDELFAALGDDPLDAMKRQAVIRVDDGEPAPDGTDINVYDSEGENVLYVLVYYLK